MTDFKYQLALKGLFSWAAYYATCKIIPQMAPMFIKSNLFGIDLCKSNRTRKIAESQGVIAGSIYMIVLIAFLPVQFAEIRLKTDELLPSYFIPNPTDNAIYYHTLFMVQIVAGLLSICLMLLLGFADDVLDLRWRTKLLLPTIASAPLLIVYALTYDSTTIIVPKPFRHWLGFSLDLGLIYYIYLSMLAVFCTNAINIVAGINGIEAGQSVMIALSIIAYNGIELFRATDYWYSHIFSLDMMLPFFGVSIGLLTHNWYPASVFVGDTYCYFAGMTFAVVGILGHFSKTMLLFFLPQVFNFLYSCPQLFHFVDCPRHRLPKYNPKSDCLEPSTFRIDTTKVSTLGALMIKILRIFRLVSYRRVSETEYECSNLTIINLTLVLLGPMRESTVTTCLLVLQSLCTVFAFFIRYGLSQIFY